MPGFLVFLLWPTLRGIYLGFTRFNLLTPAQWAGLDNYVRTVHDPIFWDAPKVTVEYVVINIGVQTVSALAIAVLLQRLTQSAVLRGIVLTPYLMSIDVTAFTRPVADKKDFTTFIYPITDYAADVFALMHPAMQNICGNGKPVTSLDQTNDQINPILSQ